MKKIGIIILIIISNSIFSYSKIGSNRNFWIISKEEYLKRIEKNQEIINKRFIIVPFYYENYFNIPKEQDPDKLLAYFSYLLKKNKTRYIDGFVKELNSNVEFTHLLVGLYYFSQKQYKKTIVEMEKYHGLNYNYIRSLIIADSHYELLEKKGNSESVINFYQQAYDQSNEKYYKELINNRIKFIKYQ